MADEKHIMKMSNVIENMKAFQSKLTSELFNAIGDLGRQMDEVRSSWVKIHGYRTLIFVNTTINTPYEGKSTISMCDGYGYLICELEYDRDLNELNFSFNRTRIENIIHEETMRRRFVKVEE